MAWYKKAFGKAYLEIYSHRDENEAQGVLALIERVYSPLFGKNMGNGLRILDLGCGHGRYSRLLSEAGHTVVGLDLSEELLKEAQENLNHGLPFSGRLCFVRADMRDVPFYKVFDLVINMFTSFGYFEEDEQNQKVLAAISRALKPGGRFLIDFLNRPQVINNLVKEDSFEQNGFRVSQSRRISPDGLRVEKTITIEGPQGLENYEESVRMFDRREMEEMLAKVGLQVEKVFGDYNGTPISDDSPRLILTGFSLE